MSNVAGAFAGHSKKALEWTRATRRVGNAVVAALPRYLGDGAQVYGVPPHGVWKPADCRDRMFSDYGQSLTLGPTQMGVAICISALEDEDSIWARVVIEFFLCTTGAMDVVVGNGAPRRVHVDAADETVIDAICADIVDYVLVMIEKPMRLA